MAEAIAANCQLEGSPVKVKSYDNHTDFVRSDANSIMHAIRDFKERCE